MCQVTGYRSRNCGHRWLTITRSCNPGVGFSTHPQHEFEGRTALFGGPKYYDASANTCPTCDLKGQYNGNTTRMVYPNGRNNYYQSGMFSGAIPSYTPAYGMFPTTPTYMPIWAGNGCHAPVSPGVYQMGNAMPYAPSYGRGYNGTIGYGYGNGQAFAPMGRICQ